MVQRNKAIQNVSMTQLPTVLVLAEPQVERRGAQEQKGLLAAFNALDTTLRRVLASGLPMLLVAPMEQAAAAMALLPHNDILGLPAPQEQQSRSDWLIECIAAGVMARAQSPGWVLLPADMPMLQSSTLLALAHALKDAPLVYPCHHHLRGHPMAVSAELYSELIRLDSEHTLRRLAARYPCADIEVGDPGIHMTLEPQAGLNQLRAQLTGPTQLPGMLRPQ